MAEGKPATKGTPRPATRTTKTGTRFEGFTDQERGAMQDRAKELQAAARRRPRAHQAHQAHQADQDAERQPLDRLAELPAADHALAERLHAIVTATAPALAPRRW